MCINLYLRQIRSHPCVNIILSEIVQCKKRNIHSPHEYQFRSIYIYAIVYKIVCDKTDYNVIYGDSCGLHLLPGEWHSGVSVRVYDGRSNVVLQIYTVVEAVFGLHDWYACISIVSLAFICHRYHFGCSRTLLRLAHTRLFIFKASNLFIYFFYMGQLFDSYINASINGLFFSFNFSVAVRSFFSRLLGSAYDCNTVHCTYSIGWLVQTFYSLFLAYSLFSAFQANAFKWCALYRAYQMKRLTDAAVEMLNRRFSFIGIFIFLLALSLSRSLSPYQRKFVCSLWKCNKEKLYLCTPKKSKKQDQNNKKSMWKGKSKRIQHNLAFDCHFHCQEITTKQLIHCVLIISIWIWKPCG